MNPMFNMTESPWSAPGPGEWWPDYMRPEAWGQQPMNQPMFPLQQQSPGVPGSASSGSRSSTSRSSRRANGSPASWTSLPQVPRPGLNMSNAGSVARDIAPGESALSEPGGGSRVGGSRAGGSRSGGSNAGGSRASRSRAASTRASRNPNTVVTGATFGQAPLGLQLRTPSQVQGNGVHGARPW
ncbi:hypothetical protein Slin14017_G129780 [Septoria linicola]|nr:hypothetical protein Slin14017_G129780 [Septoria linicola]